MLGFMAMDYFRQSPLLFYPLLALALFMVVFVVVSLRTLITHKQRYEALAALPLMDGEQTPSTRSEKEVGSVGE